MTERKRNLIEALTQLVEEKCDYMRRNNLGDPETQHTVKLAREVLASLSPPPEGEDELVNRLRLCTIDYDEKPMPDEAEPLLVHCSDLRNAADRIEALTAELASAKTENNELLEKLRLARRPKVSQEAMDWADEEIRKIEAIGRENIPSKTSSEFRTDAIKRLTAELADAREEIDSLHASCMELYNQGPAELAQANRELAAHKGALSNSGHAVDLAYAKELKAELASAKAQVTTLTTARDENIALLRAELASMRERAIVALRACERHVKQHCNSSGWYNDPAVWRLVKAVIEPVIRTLSQSTGAPQWRHKKTGGLYRIIKQEGAKIERDWSDAVIYEASDGLWIVREKTEFFDGRFEPVTGAPDENNSDN